MHMHLVAVLVALLFVLSVRSLAGQTFRTTSGRKDLED